MNKIELPPVFNTGTPAGLIGIARPKFYQHTEINPLGELPNHQCPNCGLVIEESSTDVEVEINENTTIVAFYEKDGTFHIVGEKQIHNPQSSYWDGASSGLTAFAGKEYIPDEEDVLKGVDFGEKIHLGVIYNDAVYKITPRKVFAMQGDGSYSPVPSLVSAPMQVYLLFDKDEENKVSEFDIDLSQEIELLPCHYLIWLEDQCPVFDKNYIERDFQVNGIRSGVKSSPTIGKVKYYTLWNRSTMKIHGGSVKYDNGTYFEILEGDGNLIVGKYGTYYKFTQSDYDRGFVKFRYYAKRNEGCGLKSDPSIEVKYNLNFLDESVLPPDEQLEPPSYVPPTKPPAPELEFKEVDYDYDRVIYETDYVKAVEKAGKLALINHTESLLVFNITKPGSDKRVFGGAVTPASARETSIRTTGSQKQYDLTWSITKFDLEDAVTLDFDV